MSSNRHQGKLNMSSLEKSWKLWTFLCWFSLAVIAVFMIYLNFPQNTNPRIERTEEEQARYNQKRLSAYESQLDPIENGIHLKSGMKYDENFRLVQKSCTSCHSSKLITQNRATRDGWQQMIRWMQRTQGLPELGIHEPKILDYLSTYYAPTQTGRRALLDTSKIEWYVLEL